MNRKGFALVGVMAAVGFCTVVTFPILKWYLSLNEGINEMSSRMEMQTIMQNYWDNLNSASYDKIEEAIAAKGTAWTEDVGGKYALAVSFSEDSKYENALCKVAEVAGTDDRHCRRAVLTIVSKENPSLTESRQVTHVAPYSLIVDVGNKVKAWEDKFGDYYTKTESDEQFACPWDYHLAGGKCVPCDAPTWKQYRNGNCSLYTCPTGQKANATGDGCEQIVCSGNLILEGDNCVAPVRINGACVEVSTGDSPETLTYTLTIGSWTQVRTYTVPANTASYKRCIYAAGCLWSNSHTDGCVIHVDGFHGVDGSNRCSPTATLRLNGKIIPIIVTRTYTGGAAAASC